MQCGTKSAWRSSFQIFSCPIIKNNCLSFFDQGYSFKEYSVFLTTQRRIILSRLKRSEGFFVQLDGLIVTRQGFIKIASVPRRFPLRTFPLCLMEKVGTGSHKLFIFA